MKPRPAVPPSPSGTPGWRFILALTLLAAGIRLWAVPHFAFDGDEFWTLKWTRRPYLELLTRYHTGLTMHLYLVFMKAWISVFGTSPLSVKLPTLLAGIALVPVTFAAGRRWVGPVPAAVAAGLVAFSGPLIDSARTARAYPFLAAAVILSMVCFVRAIDPGGRTALVRLALANALALVISLNAAVVLLVQGIALLVEFTVRRELRSFGTLVRFGLAFGASLGMAGLFYVATIGDILRTSEMSSGPMFRPEMLTESFVINHPAAPAVLAALLAAGAVLAARRGSTAGRLLVLWAVVPALFYFAQRLRYPDWAIARYLLVHAPAQFLLMGLAFAALVRPVPRLRGAAAAALGIALFAAAVLATPEARSFALLQPRPSNPALHRIAELARPGDVVTHDFPPFEWLIDLEPGLTSEPLQRLVADPDRHGDRLIVLVFSQPDAHAFWAPHFDVETIGGHDYRDRLDVLVSRPAAGPGIDRPIELFLDGLLAAVDTGATLDITASRHFGRLEEIHGMLETLAAESGREEDRARHAALREQAGERSREEWRSIL